MEQFDASHQDALLLQLNELREQLAVSVAIVNWLTDKKNNEVGCMDVRAENRR
jgi:hypothetical protein